MTEQSTSALDAWARLLRGSTALRRALSAELQSAYGLSINDYEALLLLSRAEGGMRRVDLAGALILTASGVTRLLDGLERAELVCKATCERDARVTYAVLTDKGCEVLARASEGHTASIRRLFEERYTPEELEQLGELLGRLPEAHVDGAACSAPHTQ